jgi:hypothetical protein
MTDQDPTLQDLWRLLGGMNRRMNERFDAVERQLIATGERLSSVDARVSSVDARLSSVEAGIAAKIGALRESVEARDFRLDEHGRRLSKLEESPP